MNRIKIGNKIISEDSPIFYIAEAGVNHNGSLKIAKKLVDIAKEAGADAVKFQSFLADEIIIPKGPKAQYHIDTTGDDNKQTWYELLKSQEISEKMHKEIISYCKKKKILFLTGKGLIEMVRKYLEKYLLPVKLSPRPNYEIKELIRLE